jgi:NitT/TauT family transport system substrate-binding protein
MGISHLRTSVGLARALRSASGSIHWESAVLKLVRSLVALLLLAAALPAAAQEPVRIRFALDWRFEGPSALFVNALRKGYFTQEGLDVQIDAGTGSAATVNRVASGAYDMGFADINALIEFLGNNPNTPQASRPVAVYMVYDTMPGAVFALRKSGIAKPADLAGRTLGAPVFDAGRKAFPIFARANGIDVKTVQWESMDPALREVMLARGEVDAITSFYFTGLPGLNARGVKDDELVVMRYPDFGVELYGSAVIATPRLIAERPQAVAAFLRALNKSIKEVIADPAAAIKVLKQHDPLIDEALELRRLQLCIQHFVVTTNTRRDGLGAISKLRLDNTIDQVIAAFGIKSPVSPDNIFNSSFLPAATARKF